jgi:enoyl-CoA hydratase/carnithine racemase
LRTELAQAAAQSVRAIIVTGAGRCFSAGADVSELAGTADDIAFDDALTEVVSSIRNGPFLSIAAVMGACLGAGFDLACACDLRIVSPSAFFELPSVRLGILYNPTAIARLHKILPDATVRRLILLGERIEGRDAIAAGIAAKLADDGQIVEIANACARQAIGAPLALIATKRLLAALEVSAADLGPWQETRVELLGSAERRDALQLAKARLQS